MHGCVMTHLRTAHNTYDRRSRLFPSRRKILVDRRVIRLRASSRDLIVGLRHGVGEGAAASLSGIRCGTQRVAVVIGACWLAIKGKGGSRCVPRWSC